MCAPPCCPPPRVSGSAGPGVGLALLPVLILVVLAAAAWRGWPAVAVALTAALTVTAGSLWLIAILAHRVNLALYGPDAAPRRPIPPDSTHAEGSWRIQATATDLPPTDTPPGRPTPVRVLTAAEVEALTTPPPAARNALPRTGQRHPDAVLPRSLGQRHTLPMLAAWPLCLPGEGPWPWMALLGLAGAAWVLGRLHRAVTCRRSTPPTWDQPVPGDARPARPVAELPRVGGAR